MSTGPQEIDEGLELASGVFTRAVRSTVDAGFPRLGSGVFNVKKGNSELMPYSRGPSTIALCQAPPQ